MGEGGAETVGLDVGEGRPGFRKCRLAWQGVRIQCVVLVRLQELMVSMLQEWKGFAR